VSAAVAKGERNEALEQRLRTILQAGDFPALSKLFAEAMSISADEDASSQRLANLVLRDYSLTVKVIRTANTLHYNRTGKPIRSATHAMLLLGVRTVRDLATSLILFEHFHKKSPGLKELMLLSMLSATQARELAAQLGLPEPEEAHLCAMFRNLGEVLVAAHFPGDYARILQKVRDQLKTQQKPNGDSADASTMRSAAASVLGFTFEELGGAVARHWGMPESVTEAMRATGTSASRPLIGVVTFVHELTTAIYRDEATRGPLRVADAVRLHGPALGVDQEAVAEVIERAVTETKDVFAAAHVSLDDLRIRKQTAEAIRILGGGTPDATAVQGTQGERESIADVRQRLLQDAESALSPERSYGLEAVILVLLEALLRGGPFDRVIFAITNSERTMVEGRLGLGDGVDQIIPRLRVSTRSAPVSMALEWRRVAIRTVERALTGDEAKWCATVGASAFGVAPLIVDAKLVGCLYADCVGSCGAEDAAPFLETVAGLASRAIASRRSAAATGAAVKSAAKAHDRAALVLRVLKGESAASVAAECGVAESDLEEWKRRFLEGAMKGLA
jgi:HD-like signal output (HDOD) protein